MSQARDGMRTSLMARYPVSFLVVHRGRSKNVRRVQLAGPQKQNCGSLGALALIGGALFAGPAAAAEPTPASLALGPFRIGMTLDEARAAAPQLAWKEFKPPNSNWQPGLTAPDAVQLGGQPHSVNISPGWYGAHRLVAVRNVEASSARACNTITQAFIADMEKQFGTFSAQAVKYDEQLPLLTGEKPAITETRKAGASSSYTWHEASWYSEASAELHNPAGLLELHSQYFAARSAQGESMCHTSLKIETKGQRPEGEDIAVANLTPVVMPSIAVLHDTALGLDIPAEGLTVVARCRVHRDRGTVGGCKSDDKLPQGFSSAVVLRSAHLAFGTAALSPGNPVPLFSNLTFRFERKQRLDIDMPTNILDASVVTRSHEFDLLPPLKGINSSMRAEYDQATVSASCQVQSDGSLVCVDFRVIRPEGEPADERLDARFLYTAKDQWLARRAAPTLKDGGAAAGRWVTLQQPFSLRRIKRS